MKTIRLLLGFAAVLALGASLAPPAFADAPATTAPAVLAVDAPSVPSALALTADDVAVSEPAILTETAASLTWQQSLIVVLTPLIIAGLKKLIPSVPKGVLPFLAPICGVLLEVISHLTTGSTLNAWAAVALGAAGVGLREAVKQVKTAVAPAAA